MNECLFSERQSLECYGIVLLTGESCFAFGITHGKTYRFEYVMATYNTTAVEQELIYSIMEIYLGIRSGILFVDSVTL